MNQPAITAVRTDAREWSEEQMARLAASLVGDRQLRVRRHAPGLTRS